MTDTKLHYLNFDLWAYRHNESTYRVRVLHAPLSCGECDEPLELEPVRMAHTAFDAYPSEETMKALGLAMFDALFTRSVLRCFRRSQEAASEGAGVRLRLRFSQEPDLAHRPWEYLLDPDSNLPLALSPQSPLLRYVELPTPPKPLDLSPPLKVLVVLSSPHDLPPLQVAEEWAGIKEALADLERQQWVEVTRLEQATLPALQEQLRKASYHILHFVGHGTFDEPQRRGVVFFEAKHGESHPVSGEKLGTLLHGYSSVRLVMLNLCEGARTSPIRALAGTAEQLVQRGIPAVIAMQAALADESALTFAQEFYRSLALGYPVDRALVEARLALYLQSEGAEWGIPVLYLRTPEGQLFELTGSPPPLVERALPFIVVVGKTEEMYAQMADRAEETLTVLGDGGRIMKGLDREATCLRYDTELTPTDTHWEALIQSFYGKIAHLEGLRDRPVPHLFFNCPAALALGLGARLGTLHRVAIYDFQPAYERVLDFSSSSPRVLRQPPAGPPLFEVEHPREITSEVFVSIFLGGHDPRGGIQQIAREQGVAAFHLSTSPERVRTEALWLPLIQEANHFLQALPQQGIRRVLLCLSAPLAFAFGLGMALGTLSPITAYQWFYREQRYFPVLDLERVRK